MRKAYRPTHLDGQGARKFWNQLAACQRALVALQTYKKHKYEAIEF
jgi:hypothetical protein